MNFNSNNLKEEKLETQSSYFKRGLYFLVFASGLAAGIHYFVKHVNFLGYIEYVSFQTKNIINGKKLIDQNPRSKNLESTYNFINNNVELALQYKSLLLNIQNELLKIKAKISNLKEKEYFNSHDLQDLEVKKHLYIQNIDNYILNLENYILGILKASDIENNPFIERKFKHLQYFPISAGINRESQYGGSLAGSVKITEYLKDDYVTSQQIETGLSKEVWINLNDTGDNSSFIEVLNHELVHVILQSQSRKYQKGLSVFNIEYYSSVDQNGGISNEDEPFYKTHICQGICREYIFEGITELIALEGLQNIGQDKKYLAYKGEVILVTLLMHFNRDLVLGWYSGKYSNQNVYEGFEKIFIELGMPQNVITGLLNEIFMEKNKLNNRGYYLSSILINLQLGIGKNIGDILDKQDIPHILYDNLKNYHIFAEE